MGRMAVRAIGIGRSRQLNAMPPDRATVWPVMYSFCTSIMTTCGHFFGGAETAERNAGGVRRRRRI